MADEKDFQQRVQRIGELVQELEAIADPAVRAAAKELVQLLMDLHGAALERMLEIVFQSSDGGTRVIDELGRIRWSAACWCCTGFIPRNCRPG